MSVRLDIGAVRAQFPILAREAYGKPLAYLDNAASAQKPRAVIDAMKEAMEGSYANVHRGLHLLANETTAKFEAARETIAQFLNADGDEIVITAGGTDAMNLVANAVGQTVRPGDEIVLTVMEHHSNIVPWHFLRERRGAVLKWVDVTDEGDVDLESFERALSPRTRICAVTHMSNVFGRETPVSAMARMAHAAGALLFVDGCQGAVHGPVDVKALGCDFYAVTGHKLYGPTGVGALYGARAALAALPPFRGGGEMIDIVEQDRITYNDPPHRFEAGTPPILEAIGLGAALRWMMAQGVDAIAAHEAELATAAIAALSELDFVEVYGTAQGKAPIFAFNIRGAHPHDVATILDRQGVAVRAGHHCAQPLMRRLGVDATARASFAAYNTHDEVRSLASALHKAHRMLV